MDLNELLGWQVLDVGMTTHDGSQVLVVVTESQRMYVNPDTLGVIEISRHNLMGDYEYQHLRLLLRERFPEIYQRLVGDNTQTITLDNSTDTVTDVEYFRHRRYVSGPFFTTGTSIDRSYASLYPSIMDSDSLPEDIQNSATRSRFNAAQRDHWIFRTTYGTSTWNGWFDPDEPRDQSQ